MQIIYTSSLYAEEENRKKNIRRQQKREGEQGIVNIGDHAKCPQCGGTGRVVWISQDGKRAGIQCSASHSQISRGDSKFGPAARPQTSPQKNVVFLIETEMVETLYST